MTKGGRAAWWGGWVITALVAALFLASAAAKVQGGKDLREGMAKFGVPESMILPLAVIELVCVAAYLIPQTAVIGAILLTGYLGGAILTHWRVGDRFEIPAALGVAVWLGVALRDGRLWKLIPLRRRDAIA